MDSIKNLNPAFQKDFFRQALFWLLVYAYYVGTANLDFYSDIGEVMFTYLIRVGIQVMVALFIINLLIPKLLNKGHQLSFFLLCLLLLIIAYGLYTASRIYILEPAYPDTYADFFTECKYITFWERLLDLRTFISKTVYFLTPTFLLLLGNLYKEKQRLSELNEQKKTAELSALKGQLNPHFLFNTLNNLYALAIKKSEKTPEVIGKLSDILDYMLYRCDEKYVSLQKEIALMDNYLALEKIRYSDRVKVSFKKSIDRNVKIAPLLLLTFIENAFKHGISQELKEGKVALSIALKDEDIIFNIENTKPDTTDQSKSETQGIGLENVKKQLELLYPNAYTLTIEEKEKTYKVTLKLKAK